VCDGFKTPQISISTMAASAASFPTAGVVLPIRWTVAVPGAQAVTTAVIKRQLAVLNQRFAPASIQFKTHSIQLKTYTGRNCFNDYQRVAALAGSSPSFLSVVVCPGPQILGLAFTTTSERQALANTVLINPSSVPGSSGAFNLGLTLVHELGHTFGLPHVFEGNTCSRDGDGFADTPFQATPTSGCPARKDSCPTKPGLDSISNYMDYSYDRCLTRFTSGQIAYMRAFAASFKPTLMRAGSAVRKPPPRAQPKPRPPPPRRPPPRPSARLPSLATHGMKLSIISPGCSGFLEAGYACDNTDLYLYNSGDESAVWDAAGPGGDWVGNVASPVMLFNRWRYFYLEEYTCDNDLVVDRFGYASVGYATTNLWRVVYTAPNTVRIQYASNPSLCLGYLRTCALPGLYDCRDSRAAVDWRVTFVRYPSRRQAAKKARRSAGAARVDAAMPLPVAIPVK
jgi:hypothetical protein